MKLLTWVEFRSSWVYVRSCGRDWSGIGLIMVIRLAITLLGEGSSILSVSMTTRIGYRMASNWHIKRNDWLHRAWTHVSPGLEWNNCWPWSDQGNGYNELEIIPNLAGCGLMFFIPIKCRNIQLCQEDILLLPHMTAVTSWWTLIYHPHNLYIIISHLLTERLRWWWHAYIWHFSHFWSLHYCNKIFLGVLVHVCSFIW